ncbi:hypothetical protein BC830DRAFT_1227451 [Chytriomyces sp. MP71]|nr:hypothetical protein BC830DRAFT_1227451 [Chytriomyces sp. MP71]
MYDKHNTKTTIAHTYAWPPRVRKRVFLLIVLFIVLGLFKGKRLQEPLASNKSSERFGGLTATTTVTVTVTSLIKPTQTSFGISKLAPIPTSYLPFYEAIEANGEAPSVTYSHNIPHYILRTWKTSNRQDILNPKPAHNDSTAFGSYPGNLSRWFRSFDEMNPDHVQILFDNDASDRFVLGFFSLWVVEAYFRLPRVVMRSDLVRYLMLYKMGGVYTDMDTECLQPVYKWTFGVKGVALLVGVENARGNRDNIQQWTIGSAQHHPFLAKLIHTVVAQIHASTDEQLNDRSQVLWITGPGIWKPAVHAYLAEQGATTDNVSCVWDGYRLFGDAMLVGKQVLASLNEHNPKTHARHYGLGKLAHGWKVQPDNEPAMRNASRAASTVAREWADRVRSYTHVQLTERVERGTLVQGVRDIPRRIAHVYHTSSLSEFPVEVRKCVSSWRERNPGYVQEVFDEAAMRGYVLRYGTETQRRAYARAPLLHHRVAFFKMLWLLHGGGVFADVDTECLQPVDTWLELAGVKGIGLVLGVQNQTRSPPRLTMHTIAAATIAHPLLQRHLDTLQRLLLTLPRKKLKQTLHYHRLHHDLFEKDAHAHLLTFEGGGFNASTEWAGVSWEGVVRVGDLVVLGQAWMRPDELERGMSLVKNYGLLWTGARRWEVGWPEDLEKKV